MWIEKCGQRHRVHRRTKNPAGPKKDFERFTTRPDAESFIQLARLIGLDAARAYVRDSSPERRAGVIARPSAQAAADGPIGQPRPAATVPRRCLSCGTRG